MKKIIPGLLLLLVAGALFLLFRGKRQQAPSSGGLAEEALARQAEVEEALVSAYSMLDGWNEAREAPDSPRDAAGSNWVWGSLPSDEAYKGAKPGEQPEIEQVELYRWSPDNEYLNYKFLALYEGIARANEAIRLARAAGDTDIEAEARFLRAHYHFDGWRIWKNIPYVTEEDEDFRKPNTKDIIPKIIGDLQFAADHLPEAQEAAGRVTKSAAQAYLGRVFLYTEAYGKAKEQLQAVIRSGNYALSPCFHDAFSHSMGNGPEMIFSVQVAVSEGFLEEQGGHFEGRLSYPNGGAAFACCGYHQPSQHLVNAYRVDADGLPMPDTYNAANTPPSGPVDPRLDWTVGRDGVPFLDYGPHSPEWPRARDWAGPYTAKKFLHDPGDNAVSSWNGQQLSVINLPVIRYADVLLMLAECEVELGNLEQARELVNRIRERAATCAQGPEGGATDIDDPDITWANYRVGTYDEPWTDKAEARRAVRFERQLELALEGHRFFDLRRWGIAKSYLNEKYLSVEKERRPYLRQSGGFEDKHMLYPLPAAQVEQSKEGGVSRLKQNPGY